MKTVSLRMLLMVFFTMFFGYTAGTLIAFSWIRKDNATVSDESIVATRDCYECLNRIDLWLWCPVACTASVLLTLIMVWQLADPHNCDKYNN